MEESTLHTQSVTSGRRNPLHFGLPKRLRAARESADLGVAQLSLAAGLSDPVATKIERGQVPYLDTIEKLARVLKVSPCWLAYERATPPDQPFRYRARSALTRIRCSAGGGRGVTFVAVAPPGGGPWRSAPRGA